MFLERAGRLRADSALDETARGGVLSGLTTQVGVAATGEALAEDVPVAHGW
jgi:hypothetical protein